MKGQGKVRGSVPYLFNDQTHTKSPTISNLDDDQTDSDAQPIISAPEGTRHQYPLRSFHPQQSESPVTLPTKQPHKKHTNKKIKAPQPESSHNNQIQQPLPHIQSSIQQPIATSPHSQLENEPNSQLLPHQPLLNQLSHIQPPPVPHHSFSPTSSPLILAIQHIRSQQEQDFHHQQLTHQLAFQHQQQTLTNLEMDYIAQSVDNICNHLGL